MSRNRFLLVLMMGILVMSAWSLTGCGGSKSSSGTGTVQIALVDAPLNATAVNVEIDKVEVHSDADGWQTVATFSPAKQVNLLDYRAGGSSLMLAESPLPVGHYTMVRLILSKAQVVTSSGTYDVDLRNVAQTGVKANGQFTVESDQLCALTLDFNAQRSFVDTGNGRYMLQPVMSMSPVNIGSSVSGSVEFQNANGEVQPLPADVVVNVYPAGHTDTTQLIAGAAVQTDGTFTIPVVMQGTYDIEIVSGGTVVKTLTNQVFTSPTTDLGKIIVTQ